jgi:hypothetical protein
VIALVSLAIVLRHSTSLVNLLDRKLDLMVQLVPAFIVGLPLVRAACWPNVFRHGYRHRDHTRISLKFSPNFTPF